MKPDTLEQYRGLLDSSEIAAGMNAAAANAKMLANDAQLLLDSGRYPTAFALATLSIEESGKLKILRELALARNDEEARECWRDYRSHIQKNQLWIFIETGKRGARRARDFSPLLEPGAEHSRLLDQLKQISLYTDCYRRGHWSVPVECVGRELAESLVRTAQLFAKKKETSVQEIELWISYLQPVWRTSRERMEQALFDWDKEMRRRGLTSAKSDVTMEMFFREGFPMGNGES